jgi:uncharacterized integral membrane protein
MAYLLLILSIVFAFLIALFAVQNSTVVSVNLLMSTIESSLVLVILGAAALGFLFAFTLQLFVQLKMRFRLYKAHARIRQLEDELKKQQEVPKVEITSNDQVANNQN